MYRREHFKNLICIFGICYMIISTSFFMVISYFKIAEFFVGSVSQYL